MRKISKVAKDVIEQPVWCAKCCIRIAPYDVRTNYQGKDYHKNCFEQLSRVVVDPSRRKLVPLGTN